MTLHSTSYNKYSLFNPYVVVFVTFDFLSLSFTGYCIYHFLLDYQLDFFPFCPRTNNPRPCPASVCFLSCAYKMTACMSRFSFRFLSFPFDVFNGHFYVFLTICFGYEGRKQELKRCYILLWGGGEGGKQGEMEKRLLYWELPQVKSSSG